MKRKYSKKVYYVRRIVISSAMVISIVSLVVLSLNTNIFAKDNKDKDANLTSTPPEIDLTKDDDDSLSEDSKNSSNNKKMSKEELEQNIKAYMGENINNLGLIYYDLETGEKISFNENNKYLAASTVKVQMNIISYDWADNGKLRLNEMLYYNETDYEDGTGILQYQDKSNPFKIQDLLDYSIIHSDNIATNMVIRKLGGSKNLRAMVNSKFKINMDTSGNYITPKGEFVILKYIYENSDDDNYAHLLEIMKNTDFHDRMDKYIPEEITAHKTGDYDKYVNDVGIVFTEKPYIFVAYTYNLEDGYEDIAKLSEMIYEYHINK